MPRFDWTLLILDVMWQLLALDISISLNHSGPVIESQPYTLQCHIPDVVRVTSVKWYKGQTLVLHQSLNISRTPKLTINLNRTDNGAQYRCEAERDASPQNLTSDFLNITVYYISISLNHSGPVIESQPYTLQCNISDLVGATSVKWYKGQTLINTSRTPELTIIPHRTDNGVQYRCEAERDASPQTLTSDFLHITVYYKPVIRETSLASEVPVFRGYPLVLVCEADGNPKPTVRWSNTNSAFIGGNLTITEPKSQNPICTANNSVGSTNTTIRLVLTDISISLNHSGPVIESQPYTLQCHIPDVVRATSVKWYKGQTLSNISRTPELTIIPHRTDNGAQYRCEAERDASPQNLTSDFLHITVYYKPVIRETSLASEVPVFRGYPLVLVCEADGNPKPTVSWSNTNSAFIGGNLTITEPKSQNPICTANNSVGSINTTIRVVLKEDYLPLIAGLVAVTVAFISVIFVFIFSIYYKTAKMGHYSLKDAKPSEQNGNIAQNGKDNPLHMKKLSQSDILAYP